MEIHKLRIDQINVPIRCREDMGDLEELGQRILARRFCAPIIVCITKSGYKLLAGERRFRSMRDHLHETYIHAIICDPGDRLAELFIERDENFRKDYNPVEMAKLGMEIEALIGNRQGQRTDLAKPPLPVNLREVAGEITHKETSSVAAKAAGFGSDKTYRDAKQVVNEAAPETVNAMANGTISVSDAAAIAKAPLAEQKKAVKAVKSGKTKTAREAVGKSDADETVDSILDKEFHVVPASCLEAFANVTKFEHLDKLTRELQACIDEVSNLKGGEHLRRHLQPTGSAEKTINKSEHLNALKRDLKFSRPHSVCPWCSGKGTKGCKGCDGLAWVAKMAWDGAEEKLKEKLK